MELKEAILTRRSRRKWLDKPVPDAVLHQILEAGRWAPSAGNYQPWAFVVVDDLTTKRRIQKVAADSKNLSRIWSPQYREGQRRGYLVDLADMPLGIAVFSNERQAPPHTGGAHGHVISASLAVQNMWLTIHSLGLGACFWSHMSQDHIRVAFGMPHHWTYIGLLGFGYVDGDGSPDGYDTSDPKLWQRKPLDDIVYYNWFKTGKGEEPPAEKLQPVVEYLGI